MLSLYSLAISEGRWEFVLHGGASEEHGGTTSNLTITGYGTKGQSRTTDLYDSRLMQTPSEGLFQVHIPLSTLFSFLI
jgi:hypothetical protein